METDQRLAALGRTLATRPERSVERVTTHQEAAVVVALRPRQQLEVLLIKRAEREADPWSGHMALPGGRRSELDRDLLATALRETEEETGVAARRVGHLLGRLDEVTPRTDRLPPIIIAPFVLGVPPDTEAFPADREVEAAVWVPLPALRAEGAVSQILIDLQEGSRAFPSIRYRDYVIWGLTHRILTQFLTIARQAGV